MRRSGRVFSSTSPADFGLLFLLSSASQKYGQRQRNRGYQFLAYYRKGLSNKLRHERQTITTLPRHSLSTRRPARCTGCLFQNVNFKRALLAWIYICVQNLFNERCSYNVDIQVSSTKILVLFNILFFSAQTSELVLHHRLLYIETIVLIFDPLTNFRF